MSLVLTRQEGQAVILSGGIKVTVVESKFGRVRLAFDAPDDVCIMREELLTHDTDAKTRWVKQKVGERVAEAVAALRETPK